LANQNLNSNLIKKAGRWSSDKITNSYIENCRSTKLTIAKNFDKVEEKIENVPKIVCEKVDNVQNIKKIEEKIENVPKIVCEKVDNVQNIEKIEEKIENVPKIVCEKGKNKVEITKTDNNFTISLNF
jgi:ABC-type enterochelin transport system substrate-binding protein